MDKVNIQIAVGNFPFFQTRIKLIALKKKKKLMILKHLSISLEELLFYLEHQQLLLELSQKCKQCYAEINIFILFFFSWRRQKQFFFEKKKKSHKLWVLFNKCSI